MTWLVRFYPARWRRRYESEFLAFIEEEGKLSLAQRLDLLLGLLDAHLNAWRDRVRHIGTPRQGMVRQAAGVGFLVLFTTSGNGGFLMRRYSLAAFFLLVGLGLGLLIPYARQTVSAALSSPPPGYTARIYQNTDIAPQGANGMTSITIVNTGRAMPRLVVTMPAKQLLGISHPQRDHKVILIHFHRFGHGVVGYSLCPLTHGQTATLYLYWPRAREIRHHQLELSYTLYGRAPHLVHGYDAHAAVREARDLPA